MWRYLGVAGLIGVYAGLILAGIALTSLTYLVAR